MVVGSSEKNSLEITNLVDVDEMIHKILKGNECPPRNCVHTEKMPKGSPMLAS